MQNLLATGCGHDYIQQGTKEIGLSSSPSHPVTFRCKKEVDETRDAQFGLVAEEVAKVDPDLVVKDESGKP